MLLRVPLRGIKTTAARLTGLIMEVHGNKAGKISEYLISNARTGSQRCARHNQTVLKFEGPSHLAVEIASIDWLVLSASFLSHFTPFLSSRDHGLASFWRDLSNLPFSLEGVRAIMHASPVVSCRTQSAIAGRKTYLVPLRLCLNRPQVCADATLGSMILTSPAAA